MGFLRVIHIIHTFIHIFPGKPCESLCGKHHLHNFFVIILQTSYNPPFYGIFRSCVLDFSTNLSTLSTLSTLKFVNFQPRFCWKTSCSLFKKCVLYCGNRKRDLPGRQKPTGYTGGCRLSLDQTDTSPAPRTHSTYLKD